MAKVMLLRSRRLLPWPKIDFAKFGAIEVQPLSRIKKISGANLSRNWVMIPAVTYHEDADITDLEAFRVQINKENEKGGGAKLTMLAFLIKACVKAMQKYPEFNSSIDGDNLVIKHYWHIGFAADTPNGLVVPVIKDADRKGVLQISQEMGELARKARDGKLSPAEMSGGCFSISSRMRPRAAECLRLARTCLSSQRRLVSLRGKVSMKSDRGMPASRTQRCITAFSSERISFRCSRMQSSRIE